MTVQVVEGSMGEGMSYEVLEPLSATQRKRERQAANRAVRQAERAGSIQEASQDVSFWSRRLELLPVWSARELADRMAVAQAHLDAAEARLKRLLR